ncbi:HD domain-containing protein [Meiothermus sp.]|uniref:HD domain-containing protein n=1 Tax=Meiothermus sp. TaxID=1955249 RepID=UPI00307E150A
MPTWSQDTYLAALAFAARAHQGQTIPGSDLPYVIHVVQVCMEVMAASDEMVQADLAIQCALLHDTLEDTSTTFAQLQGAFGSEVAEGVQALTKNTHLTKDQAMLDSLQRIQTQPKEVWMVKLADRITNLQTPPHFWTSQKIALYRAEAEIILRELGPASPYLAQRLAQKIEAYRAFE